MSSSLRWFWIVIPGIKCEIACCDWPDGRPKKGHLQEAAREMRCVWVIGSSS